jgi:hypothetical protein
MIHGGNRKLIKIRPVAVKLFRADGQTDSHDEVNSRFSQFRESSYKWLQHIYTAHHCE